jgi:hypothetical protein
MELNEKADAVAKVDTAFIANTDPPKVAIF